LQWRKTPVSKYRNAKLSLETLLLVGFVNVIFQDFEYLLEAVINIIVGLSASAHNPPRFEYQENNGIVGGAQDEAGEYGFLVRCMLAKLGVEGLQVDFLVGLQLHMRNNVLNHTGRHLKPIPVWL
jgi:hypothetical protein